MVTRQICHHRLVFPKRFLGVMTLEIAFHASINGVAGFSFG